MLAHGRDQGDEFDFRRWRGELDHYKKSLQTYTTIEFFGVGIALVSGLLYFADLDEITILTYPFIQQERSHKTKYLYCAAVGLGVSVTGYFLRKPIMKKIRLLEKTGRERGYIKASLDPSPGGIQFSLALVF